jgi:hypothetical protein
MSSVRNYLNNARNNANQNYAGFTGNPANNNGGFGNYVNYAGVNAGAAPGFGQVGTRTTVMAEGAGAGTFQPQSQPYIITISNASNTAISNFDILGAYTYLNAVNGTMPSTPAGTVNFTTGSMVVTNTGANATGFAVTVASAIANVNYQQFLYQSMNQPFQVGLTYVESINVASQITTPLTLNTQDANGNQMLRTIVPVIDPYQQQTSIVAVKQLYAIDGFTKITFSTIFANSVFRLQFYPASNINLASGLSGAPVAQSYTNPNIAGVPTVVR